MTRTIEHHLEGNGWAVGAIRLNEQEIELDTSRIIDTFSDMIDATLSICQGLPSASWDYFHEPASTRVTLLTANSAQIVEMTITRYADLHFGPIPKHVEGEVLASGTIQLKSLVNDVIAAGTRMLERHGEEGYLKEFRRPLPTAQLDMLKELRRSSFEVVTRKTK